MKIKTILIVFILLTLVMCKLRNNDSSGDNTDPEGAVNINENLPNNSAMMFVQNLGIGINIGNTLDAIGTNHWHAGETGWGNPQITRDLISALKNYGYKTIRLPVTWAEYIGPAPDYLIGDCVFENCSRCPNRMDRVAEVVNWILDEDLYCIINLHHDGGHSDKSWILNASDNPEETSAMFTAVWKQIAQKFSEVSQDKLIFESMNEIGFDNLWNRWSGGLNGKSEAFGLVNALNQIFVDTIRSAEGNEDRFLLIAGYWTDINLTCDPFFVLPSDKTDQRLILSVHYYDPSIFTIAEERDNDWGFTDTWGSPADYRHLTEQMNKLKINFLDKGIPVILGEYGVTFRNKKEEDRVKWMAAVTQYSLNYGVCPILWDTGGEISRRPPYAMRETLKSVLEILEIN